MIAGETEAILAEQAGEDNYDNFFGKRTKGRRSQSAIASRRAGRKQRRSARKGQRVQRRTERIQRRTARRNSPIRVMRRKRRSTLIRKLGNTYTASGGASGIGAQISAMTSQLNPSEVSDTPDADYKVSLGDSETPEKEAGFPKIPLIIGGVVVIGIIGAIALKKNTP